MGCAESTLDVDQRFLRGALFAVEINSDRSPRGNTQHEDDYLVVVSLKGSTLHITRHMVRYPEPSNYPDRWFDAEEAHVKEHHSYYYTSQDTVGDLLGGSAAHRRLANNVATRLAAFRKLRDGGRLPFPPNSVTLRRCVTPVRIDANGYVLEARVTAVGEQGRLLEFRNETDYEITTGKLRIDPLPSNKWTLDFTHHEKDQTFPNGKSYASFKYPRLC